MINDIHPAFPTQNNPGLTTRDYIAVMAMQAIIMANGDEDRDADDVAEVAFTYADALIARSNKVV